MIRRVEHVRTPRKLNDKKSLLNKVVVFRVTMVITKDVLIINIFGYLVFFGKYSTTKLSRVCRIY